MVDAVYAEILRRSSSDRFRMTICLHVDVQRWREPASLTAKAVAPTLCVPLKGRRLPGAAGLFDLLGYGQHQFVLMWTADNLHPDGQPFR